MVAPHNSGKYHLPQVAWYAHIVFVRVHVGILLRGESFWWGSWYMPQHLRFVLPETNVKGVSASK